MKAIGFYEHGESLDVLRVLDLPEPTPGPDEVLVRVHFAALNRLDDWVRKGWKGLNLRIPHVLGSDMAGEIVALGAKVSGWQVGDKVVANPGRWCNTCEWCERGEHSLCVHYGIVGEHFPGVYAEYVTVPERALVRVPDGYPLEKAAAAPLVYLTAWRMLFTRAGLRPGERVLVVGAGGGVNSAVIQLAKMAGAFVYVAAGGDEKKAFARDLGADVVYDYRTQEWWKEVYKDTDRRGGDVVVDNVGEAIFPYSLRALAKGGRLVTVGATTGPRSNADIRLIFWKQISIIGSTMGSQSEFRAAMRAVFEGRVNPPIDSIWPLEDYRGAITRMLKGEQKGKILFRVLQE